MIELLWQSFVAFVSVYFFAIMLESPKRSLLHCALTGSIGWFVYLLALEYVRIEVATLVAGLIIATLSQWFARLLKTPATVYFLSSFIPLVPGEGVYRAVFAFINGNYGEAQMELNETLLIAGAIALAIFLVDSMFSLSARLQTLRARKRYEDDARL